MLVRPGRHPGRTGSCRTPNPIGIDALDRGGCRDDRRTWPCSLLCAGPRASPIVVIVRRYRRSGPVVRAQIRWVAAAGSVCRSSCSRACSSVRTGCGRLWFLSIGAPARRHRHRDPALPPVRHRPDHRADARLRDRDRAPRRRVHRRRTSCSRRSVADALRRAARSRSRSRRCSSRRCSSRSGAGSRRPSTGASTARTSTPSAWSRIVRATGPRRGRPRPPARGGRGRGRRGGAAGRGRRSGCAPSVRPRPTAWPSRARGRDGPRATPRPAGGERRLAARRRRSRRDRRPGRWPARRPSRTHGRSRSTPGSSRPGASSERSSSPGGRTTASAGCCSPSGLASGWRSSGQLWAYLSLATFEGSLPGTEAGSDPRAAVQPVVLSSSCSSRCCSPTAG